MGTSKSNKALTGGVLLYSGRRNPEWPVSQSIARKLRQLWEAMPQEPNPRSRPTGLGYRGAFLRGPGNREWIAFKGIVSLKTAAGFETRSDVPREFENALLASAPAGLLPPDVLRNE
jgi:hypothetical protein